MPNHPEKRLTYRNFPQSQFKIDLGITRMEQKSTFHPPTSVGLKELMQELVTLMHTFEMGPGLGMLLGWETTEHQSTPCLGV